MLPLLNFSCNKTRICGLMSEFRALARKTSKRSLSLGFIEVIHENETNKSPGYEGVHLPEPKVISGDLAMR